MPTWRGKAVNWQKDAGIRGVSESGSSIFQTTRLFAFWRCLSISNGSDLPDTFQLLSVEVPDHLIQTLDRSSFLETGGRALQSPEKSETNGCKRVAVSRFSCLQRLFRMRATVCSILSFPKPQNLSSNCLDVSPWTAVSSMPAHITSDKARVARSPLLLIAPRCGTPRRARNCGPRAGTEAGSTA